MSDIDQRRRCGDHGIDSDLGLIPAVWQVTILGPLGVDL